MRWITGCFLLAAILDLGGLVYSRFTNDGILQPPPSEQRMAPVTVTPFEHGKTEWRRIYSGTLEAHAQFLVVPKVGGRIEKLAVDLADSVKRGQVVCFLDDVEFVQAVEQARADLAVAEAVIVVATTRWPSRTASWNASLLAFLPRPSRSGGVGEAAYSIGFQRVGICVDLRGRFKSSLNPLGQLYAFPLISCLNTACTIMRLMWAVKSEVAVI